MLTITKTPYGNRVYVFNRRLHHGTTGMIGVVSCIMLRRRQPLYALPFALMVLHDWRDFPFTDKQNHHGRIRVK